MFKPLRGKIVDMPDYDDQGLHRPFGRKLGKVPKSFTYMEQCWFDPFYKALECMCREERMRRFRAYGRMMMERSDPKEYV